MTRLAMIALIVATACTGVSASQAVPLQPGAAASAPRPPAAIAAAKDVAGKVEGAQQKNAEALDPRGGAPAQQPAAASTPAPEHAPATNVPAATAPAQPGQQPAGAASAPAGAAYSYDPTGRRDPFVSLLMRGNDTRPVGATRPPGLPGQLVGELTLKGVLKAKSGFVAILQASDNKTYLGRPGDRVMDGSIKSIAQDAVVFSQDVNDPLSLVKQREVRKAIRPETK